MPSGSGLRQIITISHYSQLIIMVALGMVRNAMHWLSVAWNGNVQEIWNLPGPEPSFSVKYHLDYWMKNILSSVVLFRNFTTPLHLLFYIAMMYPILTGERPRLLLPWLYLQMAKNVVTDVICTAAGVLLCWIRHSSGLMTLEFFVVQMISTMPSIYLWRCVRSYYIDLHYVDLDGDHSFPPTKERRGMTLAERRRASKSLDGRIPLITSSDHRSRIGSCLTWDDLFGPANWESETDNQVSKSLTTVLTVESQESDDVDEDDPSLVTIDDENLTPAEKTLKILGLTRGDVDVTTLLLCRKPSTTDLEGSRSKMPPSLDSSMYAESSIVSSTPETSEPPSVGIQVGLMDGLNIVSDLEEDEGTQESGKCACCEGTKCSREDDTDSDEEEVRSTGTVRNAEYISGEESPLDCCVRSRERNENRREIQRDTMRAGDDDVGNGETEVPFHSSFRLRAVVERDGIAWENLRKINFVSMIDKALCGEIRPFLLLKDVDDSDKKVGQSLENCSEDSENKLAFRGDTNVKKNIPEREDGAKFIHGIAESSNIDPAGFSAPTSASFGVESDILVLSTSHIFGDKPISGTPSFDLTATITEQQIRPDPDTNFNSYFKSSFQRHSKMFDGLAARLEPLSQPRYRMDSSSHRDMRGANENSHTYGKDKNPKDGKTDGSSYSLDFYRFKSSTPQYQWRDCDGYDFEREIPSGNEINLGGVNHARTKSEVPKNLNAQITSNTEKNLLSSPTSLAKRTGGPTRTVQTSSAISKGVFETDSISDPVNAGGGLELNLEAVTQMKNQGSSTTTFIAMDDFLAERESSESKSSREKVSNEQRSLASSSRISSSSRNRETTKERETLEMQALRSYNEKTLFRYKREMDARNREVSGRNESQNSLRRGSAADICGSNYNEAFNVLSVPELEKPEEELISNIEDAYARFTRSKPIGPVNSEGLHGNIMAKGCFDICNGSEKMTKDPHEMKVGGKSGMRKRHSKYSKFYNGVTLNEPDVTSMTCKRIEGLQKGRDLDRTLGMGNIRATNVETYFLERQIDDNQSTSEHVPITTIKPYSLDNRSDPLSAAVSSGNSTPRGTGSLMLEILNSPEEIPCRIEDSEYYRQLRNRNVSNSVKETVENIDWSFQRLNVVGNTQRRKEKQGANVRAGIMRSERQDIVHKTTENILQSIFSNSENSARGFRLGESENGFYPIFNTFAVAMEEIIRAAALRGYTDEFISQPAREIEIPEIVDGNLYGLTDPPSQSRQRSSSRYLKCSIVSADNKAGKTRCETQESLSIATLAAPDLRPKEQEASKREIDSLNQDEVLPIENEEESSLSSKLISSTETKTAEINSPAIGAEDIFEDVGDTSEDLGNSEIRELLDYSSILSKGSSTPKKSLFSSSSHNPEHCLQTGQRSAKISSEQVRLALQNVICQSLRQEMTNGDELQFKFGVSSCRSVLNLFNAGGNKLQSIVLELFDRFPGCEGMPRNSRGSELIAGLQMRTDLYSIETKLGGIMKATEYRGVSEESVSTGSGNLSLQRNDRSEGPMTQPGTSHTSDVGSMAATALSVNHDRRRKEDHQGRRKNNSDGRVVMEIDDEQHIEAVSSERVDKPCDEDRKLLPNIANADSVSLTHSEMSKRANFRREVISSAFTRAASQDRSSQEMMGSTEVEILARNGEEDQLKNESVSPNCGRINEDTFCNFINVKPEADMPELWMTDDDEEAKSQQPLVCPMRNTFLLDADYATSDSVLRDIDNAECTIEKMKSIFEQCLSEDQRRRAKSEKYETASGKLKKVSSVTNPRFLDNGKLQKLQNVVQKVTNYIAITSCPSAQSNNSSNELVRSEEVWNVPNAACRNGHSDFHEDGPGISSTNRVNYTADDSHVAQVSSPETRGSRQNSERPLTSKNEVGQFSSWDKVIPSSTKRLIATNSRKSKHKKTVVTREPPRRVVKVVKLIEKKDVDFFSARSVPQRGRGLSSGYLMDSDSDGNLTASRPPTPGSVESESSQGLECSDKRLGVIPNPLMASEICSVSSESHFSAPNCPVETCWSSSLIKDTFSSTKNTNLTNNLTKKIMDDGVESLQTQESPDVSVSLSPLLVEAKASPTGKSGMPGTVRDDENTQNATCDIKLSAFGEDSSSAESNLQCMKSVDAAEIENKLKDVVQRILSHQFTGIDRPTMGLRISSKYASFTPISDATRTESCADLQLNNCNPADDAAAGQEGAKTDRDKWIQESLPKNNDASIEQLDVRAKDLDLPPRIVDADPCASSPRDPRISVRNVAIGTEYNTEVFKELLDLFERIRFTENTRITGQPSRSCDVVEVDDEQSVESNSKEKMQSADPSSDFPDGIHLAISLNMSRSDSPPGLILSKNSSVTDRIPTKNVGNLVHGHVKRVEKFDGPVLTATSYDSFSSLYSLNTTEISQPSCRAMSISDHTFFEDFPEQVYISSPQLSSNFCEVAGGVCSESIQSNPRGEANEERSNQERSLPNIDKSKKDFTLQKTGIPRPVKGKKKRE